MKRIAYSYLVFFFMGGMVAWAQHGHWTDKYRNVDNSPCCGTRDCTQAHIRVISSAGDIIVLEISGIPVVLSARSFFPSEDGSDWWCAKYPSATVPSTENTRCAFITIGT